MFILTTIANMQVFSMSEFNFCYNYVFYEPFEEKTTINLNSPFEFENGAKRNKCSRTDNSLFRSVNQSTFSITIDSEFDLNQQPFSLFFFVWTNVTIVDTQINMRLTNSGHDFAFLVATVPEYSISILGSSFEFTSKDVTSFFGVANNLTEPLTVNRSSFSFDCSGPMTKFHGIAGQVQDIAVLNSSFTIEAKAVTSCGFVSLVLGQSAFQNLTVSGHLTGDNTVGFIFENKGACTISNITFSLVTSGSAVNCGFVNSPTWTLLLRVWISPNRRQLQVSDQERLHQERSVCMLDQRGQHQQRVRLSRWPRRGQRRVCELMPRRLGFRRRRVQVQDHQRRDGFQRELRLSSWPY
ncbi:Hypothetical_protein [Hexamita inflata]|uniref:Hypothetical_protein n=1 Tax=Hexamita inflata TaxID=28002 RepID=A0AA86PM25_9EUKA|nr:Hypothetical protein HINF_LOCUS29989 [Hexamita inflata]